MKIAINIYFFLQMVARIYQYRQLQNHPVQEYDDGSTKWQWKGTVNPLRPETSGTEPN